MERNNYQILIIGGGPGGYVAAIHAAQLGAKTALVEKDELGGTCLNRGCIPTKALLASAEIVAGIKQAKDFGIAVSGVEVNYPKMVERKDQVVSRLRNGVKYLLQKNGVQVYKGSGMFLDSHTILINGTQKITGEKIVIATGSVPRKLKIPGDTCSLIDSNDILELKEIPQDLVIIGGGVIGLEFGTLFHNLGSKVTIVEIMDRILPQLDVEVTEVLTRILRNKGITVLTRSRVESVKTDCGNSLAVVIGNHEIRQEIKAEKILVAPGRSPYTEGLNLEAAGVRFDQKGISVDQNFSTNIDHIYAIGDVTGGMQLAHLASAQGMTVAEHALGRHPHICLKHVPSCIYTDPEVASVGLTEEQLKKLDVKYKSARFPLHANGKALCLGTEDGFMKILYEPKNGEILGVHLLAPRATDIIAEAVLAMRSELTVGEISTSIHPHPTLSEALGETAHIAFGNPIHLI
jgi:dihydrolipoamide dehydrogenase